MRRSKSNLGRRDDAENLAKNPSTKVVAWHLHGVVPTQGPIDLAALKMVHEQGLAWLPRKPTYLHMKWDTQRGRAMRAAKPLPYTSARDAQATADEMRRGFNSSWLVIPQQNAGAQRTRETGLRGGASEARAQQRAAHPRPRSADVPRARQPALFTRLDPKRESWRRHHVGRDVGANGMTRERAVPARPKSALQLSRAAGATGPRFPYKPPNPNTEVVGARPKSAASAPSPEGMMRSLTLSGESTVRGTTVNNRSVCEGENAHRKFEVYQRMQALYRELGIEDNRDLNKLLTRAPAQPVRGVQFKETDGRAEA